MRIVKLSDLNEEEKRKVLEAQEKRYQEDQEKGKQLQKEANEAFKKINPTGKNNLSHTTTYKNILNAMNSKEQKNAFKKKNNLTIWDQVKSIASGAYQQANKTLPSSKQSKTNEQRKNEYENYVQEKQNAMLNRLAAEKAKKEKEKEDEKKKAELKAQYENNNKSTVSVTQDASSLKEQRANSYNIKSSIDKTKNISNLQKVSNATEVTNLDIQARERAEEKNKNIEKGGVDAVNEYLDTVLNNTLGGVESVASGIANVGTTGAGGITKVINKIAEATGNENLAEKTSDIYDKIIDTGKYINKKGNYNNIVNSYVDNNFVKTSGNVANTVSQMLTTAGIGSAIGVAGTGVQGLYVAGSSAQEVLNENSNNIGRATITGVAKGYVSSLTEKLFDANILTRGTNPSSIQDLVNKTISNNITSTFGKNVANKVVGIIGENAEELIEDNVDNLLDKLINNKDLPGFQEWWENTTDTVKATTLSTIVMNLLGLGGTNIQEIEKDAEAKKWINEAQKIINKENMSITYDTNKLNNNETLQGVIDRIESSNISKSKKKELTKSITDYSQNNQITDSDVQAVENTIKNTQNTTIEQNNTLSQQVNQENNKVAQNGMSEQIPKRNIIDSKVDEYIKQNKNNFNTDINIQTKIVNDGEKMATNYKNAKETTIFKKAKELFNRIGTKQFNNNNETIYVTNQDIKESIRKTLTNPAQKSQINENIAVFSSLDKIIPNAKELDVANEHKERSKYDSWKYYISEVNIDNKPCLVEFDTVLREDGQRHFRLERVYKINNEGASKTTLSAETANEVVRYGNSFY